MDALDYIGMAGVMIFFIGVIGFIISEIKLHRLRRCLQKCRQIEAEIWFNETSAKMYNRGNRNAGNT